MIVNFSLKVAEVKIPLSGSVEHMPVCSGVEISVTTEIQPSEFSAYAEVAKAQIEAVGNTLKPTL